MEARLAIALAEIAQTAPSSVPAGVPVATASESRRDDGRPVPGPLPATARTPGPAPRPVVGPHEQSTVVKTVAPAADDNVDAEDDAAVVTTPTIEDSPSAEFDEAAESAFLAEAKERGETVLPKPAAEIEESNPKALPPLDELVSKIPPQVRETLEDLFRARFVTVKRFPKKALKQ